MIFYHGTTEEKWVEIQKEGYLWGKRLIGDRVTYLATNIEEAKEYGPVILEVYYVPETLPDNYAPGCWQLRVYGPISIKNVKRLI